jgi:hypothetical protein
MVTIRVQHFHVSCELFLFVPMFFDCIQFMRKNSKWNLVILVARYFLPWGIEQELDKAMKLDLLLRPPDPEGCFGLLG